MSAARTRSVSAARAHPSRRWRSNRWPDRWPGSLPINYHWPGRVPGGHWLPLARLRGPAAPSHLASPRPSGGRRDWRDWPGRTTARRWRDRRDWRLAALPARQGPLAAPRLASTYWPRSWPRRGSQVLRRAPVRAPSARPAMLPSSHGSATDNVPRVNAYESLNSAMLPSSHGASVRT